MKKKGFENYIHFSVKFPFSHHVFCNKIVFNMLLKFDQRYNCFSHLYHDEEKRSGWQTFVKDSISQLNSGPFFYCIPFQSGLDIVRYKTINQQ